MKGCSEDGAADKHCGEVKWQRQRGFHSAEGEGKNSDPRRFISLHFGIKLVFITVCPASALKDQLIKVEV